ncbi:MAG: type II secretion system F family protein [Nitrospirae bacterium]|nr:MAG: type II secretion system F family protein [Nitrospirota bacterium]
MALYKYRGYDKGGKVIDGVIEASDRKEALRSLQLKDILPFEIEPSRKKRTWHFRRGFDRGYLFFQLGVMLRCGLPLTRALEIVIKESSNRSIADVLTEVKDDVTRGVRFSEALSRFPEVFTLVYVNMVRVAEATGGLAELLLSIAEYEDKRREQESKLKSALIYPLVVALVGSGVVGFLLMYVMPKMLRIFSSVKAELPLMTRVLVASGEFLRSYGLILSLLIGVGMVMLYRNYRSGGRLRLAIDRLFLRMSLYRKAIIVRFAELLAFQLKEGIPLVVALQGCKGVVSNQLFSDEIDRISREVEKGRSFSDAIRPSAMFDDMFKATVVTGESTGELKEFLLRVSAFMRKDVEKVTTRVLSLAEPVLIMLLGVVVGFIVLSIMLPLFELNQMVR